jgi:transcriptional regulator with PAS, ATPase and Fis domain
MQQTMQSKLLRVLEDRKIRRLGATSDVSIDVRIIAATNQNIQELLEKGNFRNDLYFRLNSFEIYIPPLRERPEDIPLLFDYYIDLFNQKLNKKIVGYDDNVINAAMVYPFPGNIRELRNMIERAIILCDGDRLTIKEFSLPGIASKQLDAEILSEKETYDLEEIEKRTIIKALEETGFKKTETAQLLNITRQSLDRRLDKYGLQF